MKKFAILLCLSFLISPLWAQSANGGILGEVVDPNKRVIQGAEVTITSLDTKNVTHLKTNKDGVYTLPSIQPGQYSVVVSNPGFGTQTEIVTVETASVSSVNFTLAVGSESLTVTVSANAVLDLDTPAINSSVEQDVLDDAPLPERSALSLVLLLPGVTVDGYGVGSEFPNGAQAEPSPGSSLAIGGGRTGSVSQLIDGSDISGNGYPRAGITFSPRAIKRLSVEAGAMPAQYGRNGGGIINQVSLNGTSQYHGLIAYRHTDPFFQWTSYGGNNQDNHQDLYTINFAGPVPIPHLNKNTFFFASVEPAKYYSLSYALERLPTPDEIAGRFHDSIDVINGTILKASGFAAALAAVRPGCACGTTPQTSYGIAYHNPLNAQGFPNPLQPVYTSGSQYQPAIGASGSPTIGDNPNNYDDVSAQAAQNPLMQYLASILPTPSNPGKYTNFFNANGYPNSAGFNSTIARGVFGTNNRESIRLDHNFKNSDTIFARFSYVPVSGTRYGFLGPNSPANPIVSESVKSYNAVVGFTHIFSQNKVNELRGAYLLLNDEQTVPTASTNADYAAKFGLYPAINGKGFPELLGLDFAGNDTVLGTGFANGENLQQNYVFGDDFSWLVGRHQLKMGLEFRALEEDQITEAGYGGNYTFSSSLTQATSGGGSGLATLDLGLISAATIQGSSPFYYRWKYGAAYVEDTWRALPKLTLVYGLRYNVETPQQEKFGNQGIFLPNVVGTFNGLPATGAFVFSGQNGTPKTLWPVNYGGVEPRISIAVQPAQRVVLRAGYAIIHAPLSGISNGIHPNLVSGNQAPVGGLNGGTVANESVDFITNPIAPVSVLPPGGGTRSGPVFNFNGSDIVPQTNAVPYIQTYTASVQVAIGHNFSVETDYVGQHGIHLFSPQQNRNVPPLDVIENYIQQGISFGVTAVSPYGPSTVVTGSGLQAGPGNVNFLNSLNPYPQQANNQILTTFARDSSSIYNALYVSGRGRVGYGLTLQGAFSWSKSLDTASFGISDGSTGSFGYVGPQTPYNLNGEYAASLFDVPVNVSLGYSWTLPVGRGQKYFANHGRLLDLLVGGWKTSGIGRVTDGAPLYVLLGGSGYFKSTAAGATFGNNGNALPSGFNLRPNIVPGVPLIHKNWRLDPTSTTPYLNGAAFAVPGSFNNPQFGTASRTLTNARSPEMEFLDASVRKGIPIEALHRHINLELQADVTNLLNHTNWAFNGSATYHTLNPTPCAALAPTPAQIASGCTANGTYDAAPAGSTNPGDISTGLFGTTPNYYPARSIFVGALLTF